MDILYLIVSFLGITKNFNIKLYKPTTPFCYIKIHTNPKTLPDKINKYTYTNTYNRTMMSITGYESKGFESNQPIYFAITNLANINAVLTTSLTIDQPPQYGESIPPPVERGISYSSIVSIVIVIIFAIIIIICVVICCRRNKSKRHRNRRHDTTTTSNSNRNYNNNNNNGGAANMTVPTEVDNAYVAPSYPSGAANTYPYPYPQAGYPPQSPPGAPAGVTNPPGAAGVATPTSAYQPSPPPPPSTNEAFPVVDPQPVSGDKNKIQPTNSNQGIPTVNPYDPANFPSVNANNNANRVSYYPPYANPDDDK